MHQSRPITKIVHLLNEQDDSDLSIQCQVPLSGSTLDMGNDKRSHALAANAAPRVSKKPPTSKGNNGQKVRTLGSELVSSKSESTTPFAKKSQASKSKSSGQFDIERLRRTKITPGRNSSTLKVYHENSGLFYEISTNSVPVFKVLKSQVPDPIVFYESVKDLGSQHGCVKLVFCDSNGAFQYEEKESCDKFGGNPDQFWFRAVTQFTGSLGANKQHMYEFYRDLLNYHEMTKDEGQNFSRVPSINKRVLDLYRLFNCVRLRGGYEAVCQEKLWAQIGRELGYSGRIMSSLSTSLRLAYVKVLLGYEQYLKNKNEKGPHEVAIPMIEQKQDDGFLNQGADNEYIFEVAHSAAEYKVLRELSEVKGCTKHYSVESHGVCTDKHNHSLPRCESNAWQVGLETYESNVFNSHCSPIYDLRQYYEKSERHIESLRTKYANSSSEFTSNFQEFEQPNFERLFFEFLSSGKEPHFVDTGLGLEAAAHNFGSSFIPNNKDKYNAFKDQWNLENFPLQENSLLRHLDLDFRNYTHTTVNVGMLFSVEGWHTNGNFLPSINYNHLGAAKLWYVVPSTDMEKFELLVETINNKLHFENSQVSPPCIYDEKLKNSEFYKCYSESALLLHDEWVGPEKSSRAAGKTTSQKSLPGDLLLHPKLLERHGIKWLTVTQESGTYIFTFPKAYTSNIASGFCASENAFFAPHSWLCNNILEGSEWFYKNNMLPGILPFQFLLNITSYKDNTSFSRTAKHILKQLAQEEIHYRSKVRKALNEKGCIKNKFDYISDISFKPAGGSKVVITDSLDTKTLTCEEFLKMITESELEKLSACERKVLLQNSQLHIYCSDERIMSILSESDDLCNSNKYEGEDSNDVLFKNLKALQKEGTVPLAILEGLSRKINPEIPWFAEFEELLFKVRALQQDCERILSSFTSSCQVDAFENLGNGLNLDEPQVGNGDLDLAFFHSIVHKIEESCVTFPSMFEVLRRRGDVNAFEVKLKESLQSKTLVDLKYAYSLGRWLNVASKYLEPVVYWMCRNKWLESYQTLLTSNSKHISVAYTIHDLHSFLKYGIKYCGAEQSEKLQKVKQIIVKSQNVINLINGILNHKHTGEFKLDDLKNVVQMAFEECLPVNQELTTTLVSILNAVNGAKDKLSPLLQMIDVNRPFQFQLIEGIKKNSKDSLQLLTKFDGSTNDKRIAMSDVLSQKFFSDNIKACKNWINKVNKIFTKSKREKLRNRLLSALDVKFDKYHKKDDSEPTENQEIYCFCRRGDIGGTMIECEVCKEWYHTGCIAPHTWKLPQDSNSVFVCSVCSPRVCVSSASIDYSIIQNLFLESVKLKLAPDRQMLSDVSSIFESLFLFKIDMMERLSISEGQLAPDVTLNQAKHYLRKLIKSNCRFASWDGVLEAFCQVKNVELNEDLKSRRLVILTGPESIMHANETSVASSTTSDVPNTPEKAEDAERKIKIEKD
ncbi:hypothetical protein HG535_0B01160 [Zygotorulaspora mrakii]|uniref:[Histone H3]-trimethyl-L-lysine(4) demethylase n=1 Tax=Zygotorulaspora mrakii TaxID=42260 RepID=A0A7H9AXD8_ZYGMR|nr:uncharacterized protein HG535_0B01160 [Zygotorulaspora mrakii]QLG71078.1 hypothetical protein HG535_0B01160 [Zygotorulaspora mrakii]